MLRVTFQSTSVMPLSMVPFTPSETLPSVLDLLSVRLKTLLRVDLILFYANFHIILIQLTTIRNTPGPALSGTLVQTIGFEWMLFGIAIISFMYAPLLYYLRNPPTKEERQVKMKSFNTFSTSRPNLTYCKTSCKCHCNPTMLQLASTYNF